MSRTSLMGAILSILVRLPLGFLIPFILLSGSWVYFFKRVKELLRVVFGNPLGALPLDRLEDILIASFIVLLFLAGIFTSYNLSVFINWLLVRYGLKPRSLGAVTAYRPSYCDSPRRNLDDVEKIGIVLAGGGAKGAFQAGAMKAIYQFLSENNALHKVKVISGTSIGSWNALFWLTDLIASERGWDHPSAHEIWWRSISLKSLIAPSWYVPCLRNAFFATTPWQRQFDDLFSNDVVKEKIVRSDIHFYFTRSHVRSGKLECTTNSQDVRDLPRVSFTRISRKKSDQDFLEGVKAGVFASMDLPPLFPYIEMADEEFEDGGVVDNLPVMFAAMESCDLIFVLPLNSDFNAEPNHRSLLSRFIRVMDVRQGALERGNLKSLYLYNELAVLRKYAQALQDRLNQADLVLPTSKAVEMSETLRRALARSHEAARLFGICPQRTLVESTIDTAEFWKAREAGRAFATMYKRTSFVLENSFDPKSERIEMALIDPAEIRWSWDF